MDISLNLGKTSFGDTFAVRVNDTNQIRISELKFLIWNEKKEIEEYQLSVNNIVDIEDKLGDVKLSLDRMLENYFSVIPITTSIHIIVLVPTAADRDLNLEEVIKNITKGLGKRDPKLSDKLDMRDFKSAVERIHESVYGKSLFDYVIPELNQFGRDLFDKSDDKSLKTFREIDSWDKLDISNNSSIIRPTIIRKSPGISHLVDTESCGYTIM
ncbi:hypothetical protein GLOIN_2v1772612 [Rhizophagus irregularis DAOM 181602=DAOM 197198]|uniref:Uncharacterized protein n=1 Tax=Rhizophagus irregularis (strain DAOM 181602 / DAOM 197198 / MUCL 43194) TaxID=747089 RepID=A0A2P4Q6U8_RHIID|nr:hypothetical protein GLOIN_2v1772612 [Rhizophagus irregularis DAOM 181602=DAOM 197198]POG73367.1 hypothetical protein GLOIN_2v1772612 [Rhizophagus irregularis DAOM 181602=DAOM 197198]|eukprot:XP_025180233.1 hypothetical protein GLOIN_2v1772612 [Rhizophagus irregularis DAOM 181602=DAOM 197198]